MNCPRADGHGSGPYPSGACYRCWKTAALAGQPLPTDVRAYAGFPEPRPRPRDGWRPADSLPWPDLEPLERRRTFRATDPIRALAAASSSRGSVGEGS